MASTILAENIVATNEIRGNSIKSSTIITAGSGNNVGVLDGSDATYRIYAGDATPGSAPFRVTQAGIITVQEGSTIDYTYITGTKPPSDATNGAVWGNNLGSIPTRFGDSASSPGLYLTGSYLGYWNGVDAWDVYIGNNGYFGFTGDADNYLTWNGSNLTVKGTITVVGGSGIGSFTDAGDLAELDKVGASNCDTTIISGGKIITGLLTASNIKTGTLDASTVTVSNLSASNITTGTLNFSSISRSSLSVLIQPLVDDLARGILR